MLRMVTVLAVGTLLTLETQPLEVQLGWSAPIGRSRIASAGGASAD